MADIEKLQEENKNLKLELESSRRTVEEKDIEIKRERKNTATSQSLNEALSKEIKTLKGVSSLPEGYKGEEIVDISHEKAKFEHQIIEKEAEIYKIRLELQSANEEISQLKNKDAKPEVIDLELRLGQTIEENKKLKQENEYLSQENEERREDSKILRRLSEPGTKPVLRKQFSNEPSPLGAVTELTLPGFPKNEDMNETAKNLLKREAELSECKEKIDELEFQIANSKLRDAQFFEKLQLESKEKDGEYQQLVNQNNELQAEVNKLKLDRDRLKVDIKYLKEELKQFQMKLTESLEKSIHPEKDEQFVTSCRHVSKNPGVDHSVTIPPSIPNPPPLQNCPIRSHFSPNSNFALNPLRTPTKDPPTRFIQPIPQQEPPFGDETGQITPTGDRAQVTICWKKEIPTMERKVNYYDITENIMHLGWDDGEECYIGHGKFGTGKHGGSIAFPTKGDLHEVQTYEVEMKDEGIKILLKLADVIKGDNMP